MRTVLSLPVLAGLLLLCAATLADDDDWDNNDFDLVCNEHINCTCSNQIDDPTVDCNYAVFKKDNVALSTADIGFSLKDYSPRRVHLRGCQIATLKKVVSKNADSLRELDLSDNIISRIAPSAFAGMDHLNQLNLAHNRLDKIRRDMFHDDLGFKLHKLDLSYNYIKTVSANDFENLKELKILILDGNKELAITRESFIGLRNLESLSLDYCDFEHLENNIFDQLPNLKHLSLRGNLFSSIPKAVNSIIYLEILDMSHTNVAEISENALTKDHQIKQILMTNMPFLYSINNCSFCGLQHLENVNFFNSSHLYDINGNAFGMDMEHEEERTKNLTKINFANCNITTLSLGLFEFEDLDEFYLEGNPISCECFSSHLSSSRINYMDSPTCAFPNRLNGVKLTKATHMCGFNLTSIFESFLLLYCICILLIGGSLFWAKGRCSNIFYKPDMPHIGYSNLTARMEDDQKQLQHDFDAPVSV